MDEPPLDRQTVADPIRLLMRIDARLAELQAQLAEEEDDDETES
jgi:hypothetical protein